MNDMVIVLLAIVAPILAADVVVERGNRATFGRRSPILENKNIL